MKTLATPELSDFSAILIDGEVWRIALGSIWQGREGVKAQARERVLMHEREVGRAMESVVLTTLCGIE